MSTIFGIKIKGEVELIKDALPPFHKYKFIEVFYRANISMGNYWINPLAKMLTNNTKVYPLDNTAQGIYTIGDIKKSLCQEAK